MADHSKPTLTSTYTNFVTEVDGRFDDQARLFSTEFASATNLITGTVRWNNTSNKWERWSGTSWSDLTSTYGISISGNAATASTLATARLINGTSFNGSSDITTASWGTSRTLTLGSTGKTVDGSANVTWTLNEIGAAAINQTMFIGTTSIPINRVSATQTLTGVSIDGNAGTVTNGVYLTGDQTIAGNKTFTGVITAGASIREKQAALAANNVDLSLGNYFTKTISTASTLTVSNIPASGTASSFILDLTNGGSAVITWWANVKWASGTAPVLTTSGRDVLGFFTHNGGTTWTGLLLGKDIK